MEIKTITKRDGSVVEFNAIKITDAVLKALNATLGEKKENKIIAENISSEVVRKLCAFFLKRDIPITIEICQDLVEDELMIQDQRATAKAYILYRQEHFKLRGKFIPIDVKKSFEESLKYFKSPYEMLVALRTYSRWLPDKGRRETWPEIVQRFMDFMRYKLGDKLSEEKYNEIYLAILRQEVAPSMRLLQFAGEAAKRNELVAYNCCFIAPESIGDFVDLFYILMCGTGVAFSVEREIIEKLPIIKEQNGTKINFTVPDTREGWAESFRIGLNTWFNGSDIEFDYSLVRPQGARLVVSGGFASGPAPLKELHDFARKKILAKQGKKLLPIDVHDILCTTGNSVVVGGVRRASLLSLSDLDDIAMRDCKTGNFWNDPDRKQRSMANNSASYNIIPTDLELITEFQHLIENNSGERGIFNRKAVIETMPKRRKLELTDEEAKKIGTNPCAEIILLPNELCNLSSVICREDDTVESLLKKQELSALIGTFQASLTNFHHVSPKFAENCKREALLGCSLNGIMDCPAIRNESVLKQMKEKAINTNIYYAKLFGINSSVAVTCVKPEGTSAEVFGCSSGIHPAYDDYYIRRIRISVSDPLAQLLKDEGVPCNPENGTNWDNCRILVFDFPKKSSSNSINRNKMSAIQMLEFWKMIKINYTEHNPSITINVKSNEWIEVINWVKSNWNIVCGISFLPYADFVYTLAPFESITKEKYDQLKASFPEINFSKIVYYEKEDKTTRKDTSACEGDKCLLN